MSHCFLAVLLKSQLLHRKWHIFCVSQHIQNNEWLPVAVSLASVNNVVDFIVLFSKKQKALPCKPIYTSPL